MLLPVFKKIKNMQSSNKILIYLLIILGAISFTACSQNSEKQKPFLMGQKSILKKHKITYAIHINAKTPYEIFIDDIPLPGFGRTYESGMNTTLELNPYLLKNGKHILKVRYLPRETSTDSLVHPTDIYNSKDSKWNIFFVKYIKNAEEPLGYEGEIDYTNSELKVIAPPEAVPVWEQIFELDIKDLPYELKGWSESDDLSKMDKESLKMEVFDYFKMIRNTLNDGNIKKFLEMNKVRDSEFAIATYDDNLEWYDSEERKQELISDCKNNMWKIEPEEYALKIYANGKLATIERINILKNKCLIAETETDYWY